MRLSEGQFGIFWGSFVYKSFWKFNSRVEKEHLANVGNFRVVQDMKLPYSNISFEESTEEVNGFTFFKVSKY